MLRKLEGSITKRLRYMLQGTALFMDNTWVRTTCHMPTVSSSLLIARLRFWRGVLQMQGNLTTADSPLPAVLPGCGRHPDSAQLCENGSPRDDCSPWLAMYAKDVRAACHANVLPAMPTAVSEWLDVPEFQQGSFHKLQSFVADVSDRRAIEPLLLEAPITCLQCARVFETKRALKTHVSTSHLDRRRAKMLQMCNMCPWCSTTFSGRWSLQEHVQKRMRSGVCPVSTRAHRSDLRCAQQLTCPRCRWHTTEVKAYLQHVRDNYMSDACTTSQTAQHVQSAIPGSAPRAKIIDLDSDHETVGWSRGFGAGSGSAAAHDNRPSGGQKQSSSQRAELTAPERGAPRGRRRIAVAHSAPGTVDSTTNAPIIFSGQPDSGSSRHESICGGLQGNRPAGSSIDR